MTADKDFRGKLTAEAWCAIEAEHRISGLDHQAIVRDVLHAWASRMSEVASITQKLLEAEGSARRAGDEH
jgi:hypothetical protein